MTNLYSPTRLRESAAVSGLLLVVFVIVHLLGLIPALMLPEAFESYAAMLHNSRWTPVIEIGVVISALVHITTTILKYLNNQSAGNHASLTSRRAAPIAAFASRTKAFAGIILLGFLIIHISQLRFTRPSDGFELAALQQILTQPLYLVIYISGSLAIALHLLHGAEAAHRSLGWLHPGNSKVLHQVGRVLASLIGGGFILISLAIALGSAA